MDRDRIAAMERDLAQIPGIVSARIREAENGAIDAVSEIHVVAEAGVPTGGLPDQVRTTLFARHGTVVDPDAVRIAFAISEDSVFDLTGSESSDRLDTDRILFHSVNVYREGLRAEAQVELLRGDERLIGASEGPAVSRSLPRLVAQATLDALKRIVGDSLALELVALERRRLGGRRIMLCHLIVLRGREETHLSGSVLVTNDPLEAIVFSVLDALNRILPGLEEDWVEYDVEPLPARSHS